MVFRIRMRGFDLTAARIELLSSAALTALAVGVRATLSGSSGGSALGPSSNTVMSSRAGWSGILSSSFSEGTTLLSSSAWLDEVCLWSIAGADCLGLARRGFRIPPDGTGAAGDDREDRPDILARSCMIFHTR